MHCWPKKPKGQEANIAMMQNAHSPDAPELLAASWDKLNAQEHHRIVQASDKSLRFFLHARVEEGVLSFGAPLHLYLQLKDEFYKIRHGLVIKHKYGLSNRPKQQGKVTILTYT